MKRRLQTARSAALVIGAAACQKAQTAPLYEAVPVTHRDIVVTASASGVMQPILTFSVKSKAWGEIIEMPVQTGDEVRKGQLLARIDPRIPQQNLAQAQAALDKARAQLETATGQLKRSEALYHSMSISETEYESSKLAHAIAQAAVVNAGAGLQTAKDAMDDTQVRAPIAGSILYLQAVLGTVISSPTLGGGTVILRMANLDTVQDSAMVTETDIGIRWHGAEDRAAGAGRAKRHELPRVCEHPEPGTPSQAGNEHGSADSHRTPRRCARRALRRVADAA